MTTTPVTTCRRWSPVMLKNVAPTSGVPPRGFRNGRQPSPIMTIHSRRCSAASATMNTQMPSLREVAPNGDGSRTAVSSATDRQKGKEIEPEDGHEVPIQRRSFKRRARQHAGGEPALHKPEPAETPQHVQGVQHGKYVEECAARTRRQMEVLRGELAPRQSLTGE